MPEGVTEFRLHQNIPSPVPELIKSLWNKGPRRCSTSKDSAAAANLLQSCPTLCDPIDGSWLGCSVPGILQAGILGWVAISFSNAWKWKVKVKSLSHARLLATPWTGAYQAPLFMGFSGHEYWSGVPLPSPQRTLEWNKYAQHYKLPILEIHRIQECIKNSEKSY